MRFEDHGNTAKTAEEKRLLRSKMRRRRKQMTEKERAEKSSQIQNALTDLQIFRDAEEIWLYVSLPEEVDTDGIIRLCFALGKKVAVPKVEDVTDVAGHTESVLRFYYITSFSDLREGSFHVREPETGLRAENPESLILLPGLAFSTGCMRMGYGKSYYDRYLQKELHPTAALAFDFSVFPEIPHGAGDVGADYVITETRVFTATK